MHSDAPAGLAYADYATPILQRKWLILVAVIVTTGSVYAYYSQRPKQYTAATLVFTQDLGDALAAASPLPSTDRSVHNQAALLYSRDVAAAVKQRITYAGSPSELLASVTIAPRDGQDIIEISARADEPGLAAGIANGYAQEFVARANAAQRRRVQQTAKVSREQLRSIPTGADTRSARQAIADRIRALQLALRVPPAGTRQIDAAVAPSAAVAPKPVRNALFAFLLSLVLAMSLAVGLERFDRRVKRPQDAEALLGVPVLAVIAHSADPAPQQEGAAVLGPDLLEAFRLLRTNIELGDGDQTSRTIVVTSAMRGEGKSTVVRNLALAFRETGRRVAVVECDLRRPSLAGMFAQDRGVGLTEVLCGEARLEDVVLRAPVHVAGRDDRSTGADESAGASADGTPRAAPRPAADTITLLLSGAPTANPPLLLGSAPVREILDGLAASHDVTLIDSAPLLSLSDSVPLVRYADAVVVVVRLNDTPREAAERVGELLERVPDARPIGVVANDMAARQAGYADAAAYANDAGPARRSTRDPGSAPSPQTV